ncbi:MAG: class I SAM-dependent methyltransferase, partial [Phycisphaerae bacterium]|nr:class I SAM-dependent methyltransferase [Phycisphaerae bacterium]
MTDVDPRIAFFNQHADNWDTYGPPVEQTLRRLEELKPMLNLQPGWSVLELGCGTGQVTGWLAGQVRLGSVTAVDFSPGMIAKCRERDVEAVFRCLDVCT